MQTQNKKLATAVDAEVGERIRLRRKECGLSQAELGQPLGVTLQQIQKYETGQNRVSASRLAIIAGVLRVPVSYFFDDTIRIPNELPDWIDTPEGTRLNAAFMKVKDAQRRKAILALVRAVADNEADITLGYTQNLQ